MLRSRTTHKDIEVTALREQITVLLDEAVAFERQTVALEAEVRRRWRRRRISIPRWEQRWEIRSRPRVVVVAALRVDASATTALTVSVLDINQTGKEQDAASAIPPVIQENVWMVANK